MQKWAFLVAFPLLAATIGASTDQRSVASVTIQVVQCAEGRTEVPELFVASALSWPAPPKYEKVDAVAQRLNDGYYDVSADLPQGNYFFKLESEHCSDYLQSAVLGGRARTLSVALVRRMVGKKHYYVAHLQAIANAVAGELPVRPGVAYIVSQTGAKRILDLQDGAYYIERVYPGRYTVRIEFHGGFQSEIPLDLSGISDTQLVEHDFDMAAIRRHLGNILANGDTVENCEWCY